ncbi:MAG TPA: pyrroline-5-carboxylate reductase dimerization domain-containing protein, partial [Solirubrobacteraceae bacterium]
MRIGLIGAGNMARALARGLGGPVLVSDHGSGRAAALAAELGGEAASSADVAAAADVVVLCHKPAGLAEVAGEIRPRAVASVLASTPLADLRAAYPGVPVVRLMPNLPVEVRRGVFCLAAEEPGERELAERLRPLFAPLGMVVDVADHLVDAAMAVVGCGTGFLTVVAEAQADSAVRQGLPAPVARELAVAGMGGAADLLRARGGDTAAVRRDVTSPGGSTARGLAALER